MTSTDKAVYDKQYRETLARRDFVPIPDMKWCRRCNTHKSSNEFNRCSNRLDGLVVQCKVCIKKINRAGYEKHHAARLVMAKTWRDANPEKNRTAAKIWKQNNRVRASLLNHKRRILLAGGPQASAEEWVALCTKYDNKCLRCLKTKPLSIDHIIPVSRGGTNTIDNLQPLCKVCNSIKHTQDWDFRTNHIAANAYVN